jgi:hypothetical protein
MTLPILRLSGALLLIALTGRRITAQAYSLPLQLVCGASQEGQLSAAGNTLTLHWSLGEPLIGAGGFDGKAVTNGLQQPFKEMSVSTSAAAAHQIDVFPNPAHDYVQVEGLPHPGAIIFLTSPDGRIVYRNVADGGRLRIDTNGLAPGAYRLYIRLTPNAISYHNLIIL